MPRPRSSCTFVNSRNSISLFICSVLSIVFLFNGAIPLVQASLKCRDTLKPVFLYTFNERNGSSTIHDLSFFQNGKKPFSLNLRDPTGSSSGFLVSGVLYSPFSLPCSLHFTLSIHSLPLLLFLICVSTLFSASHT